MSEADAVEYPELLTDLADKLTEALVARGIERVKAKEISREAAEFVRAEWGGLLVYVPKGTLFALGQRDIEIWREFNGHNHAELARKHDVTLQRIYQIVAAMREQEVRRRQGKLF
jgi:Mor family transcriptional regulator